MLTSLKLNKFNIDINKKYFWAITVVLVLFKLALSSQQLIYASPELSPIDDTLMFNLAKSITEGNWLGEYNWLTLSKHSFYALWLAFLNIFKINVVVGGQMLYAAAAILAVQALTPVMKSLPRLILFALLFYIPTSYSEFTLRIYRDNIYPSLVLLALGCLIGAYLRYNLPSEKSTLWLIASGLGFGAAWLTHEDNVLLLPFFVCASAFYAFFVIKNKSIKKKGRYLVKIAVPILICLLCSAGWSYMNFQHYGRFIVSDFTSSEFNNAMGALSRVNPKAQKQYVLVPYETRQMIYKISPSFALLEPYLENENTYNSFGSIEDKEINSGGIHWAIRQSAAKAGFYKNAQKAAQFYNAVAQEVNAACDEGKVSAGKKQSGVFAPFKMQYLAPTLERFGESLSTLMFYTQTRPSSEFSIATPEQSAEWESFLHATSTKSAIAYTADPYFSPIQKIAINIFEGITWLYRILIYPLMILSALWAAKAFVTALKEIKARALGVNSFAAVLVLGMLLTGILRIAAIAYISAVAMKIATLNAGVYIMYLAPACAPIMLFLGYAAIKALLGENGEETA